MFPIFIKEIKHFVNNLTGLVAIAIFLLTNGLFLFFFPNTSVLDYGYASLEFLFDIGPYVLIQLISSITMKQFAEEFKSGNYEILITKPIGIGEIIFGKFFACLTIVTISLLPTIFYAYSLSCLSASGNGVDIGGMMGSYLGLFLTATVFVAVGIFCSSISNNNVVAFLLSCLLCYILFDGLNQVASMAVFSSRVSFILEIFGLQYHYQSLSKGVLYVKELIYFISVALFFIALTYKQLLKKGK